MCSLYFFCRKTTHTCVTLSANASANDTPPLLPCQCVRRWLRTLTTTIQRRHTSKKSRLLHFNISAEFCVSLQLNFFICLLHISDHKKSSLLLLLSFHFFVDLCFQHTSGSCSFSTEICRASGRVCVAKGALFLTLKARDCKYDAAADTEAVRHLC